jgi:hypothetical protein
MPAVMAKHTAGFTSRATRLYWPCMETNLVQRAAAPGTASSRTARLAPTTRRCNGALPALMTSCRASMVHRLRGAGSATPAGPGGSRAQASRFGWPDMPCNLLGRSCPYLGVTFRDPRVVSREWRTSVQRAVHASARRGLIAFIAAASALIVNGAPAVSADAGTPARVALPDPNLGAGSPGGTASPANPQLTMALRVYLSGRDPQGGGVRRARRVRPAQPRLRPLPPARSPSVALKLVQTKVPSGLAASSVGGSRHPTRKHMAAVPRIPGSQPACLGRQRHRRIRHASANYQQVSLSVTASVQGDSGHVPGASAEGLDQWSSDDRWRRAMMVTRRRGACHRIRRRTGRI